MDYSHVSTTDDLIALIPEWLTVGALVEVDEVVLSCSDDYNGQIMGIVLSLFVIDINDQTTREELEEMIHYGEWLHCEVLIDNQIIETDINTVYEVKEEKKYAKNVT